MPGNWRLYFGQKNSPFPNRFVYLVSFVTNRTMRFFFSPFQKKNSNLRWEYIIFGNKLNFFPQKILHRFIQPPFWIAASHHWIIEKFPPGPNGEFRFPLLKAGPIHFFGNQPNGFYAATQVILLALKRGKGGGGWLVGRLVKVGEVGVVVFLFNRQVGWLQIWFRFYCAIFY